MKPKNELNLNDIFLAAFLASLIMGVIYYGPQINREMVNLSAHCTNALFGILGLPTHPPF